MAQEVVDPFASFTRVWRDDPVWHDGKAECAVYDAVRVIYGEPRAYQARLYTNKEMADPVTKTKSSDSRGREVFKHHLREDAATENYAYHFSTMVYVGAADLKSLKIDIGSQEDCGATFKQFVNHAGTLQWHQFSYFPDEGHCSGSYSPPANLAYHNALSLVLRGYPFDEPREVEIALVADQTSNRLTPAEPLPGAGTIRYVGREALVLPVGTVDAHHLRVTAGQQTHDYWFAARGEGGAGLAGLHIMVQYEGPGGLSYKLRGVDRRAYWE